MKKISLVALTVILLCALILAACQSPAPEPEPEPGPPVSTEHDLVLNSASSYKIVYPSAATKQETLAANELRRFILQATGAEIETVGDGGLTLSSESEYISVGDTALLRQSQIAVNENELNGDGFRIVTKDKSVFLCGGSSYAPLYAAYEFLSLQFGYAYYAVDEIVAPFKASVKLMSFDVTEVPDFRHRNVYDKAIKDDEYQRALFRSRDNMETWGTYGHSSLIILPHSTYYGSNPEWFSSADSAKAQPCWTNEEGRKQMTENLKEIILSCNPDQTLYMVGQMDTNTVCQCSDCNIAHAKYGSPSGTMMVYINKIADDIETWRKQAIPDRNVTVGTFAYQLTLVPPADSVGGEYVPRHPDVVARDNVLVQYAPLGACYSHDLVGDGCCDWNKKFQEQIRGWQSVAKTFAIWNYSAFFTDYFLFFNNFNTLQSDYKLYKELGAVSLFCQGTGETIGTPFHNLRVFLRSQLMWDVNSDVNKLTEDFFVNYYKDTYAPMKEYYNLMRLYYQDLDMHAHVYDIMGENIKQKKYWDKRLLIKAMELFDRAYSIADGLADRELGEKLRLRILNETFGIRFLLIDLHGSDMEKEEVLAMIDDFENDALEAGVACYRENRNVQELYGNWRVKYN